MGPAIEQYDRKDRYCPMLGHRVTFAYCRAPGSDLPCRRIFDCWWRMIDIEGFIREHFDESTIDNILAPRKDKMLNLVNLIRKAQEGNKPSEQDQDPQ